MEPNIRPAARRHGISDADILHAYRNAFDVYEFDDTAMIIGGDRSGRPLELMIRFRGPIPEVFHAMPARPRFLRRRWNGEP
ncbi:hypothetical protein [Candidatus Poriferisodalis sp.]|uniref:hypothetical protein n=1 Tax=Candidatus Poriferisodalis sp. TaxID=3101277 RepID=UPI003C6EBA44